MLPPEMKKLKLEDENARLKKIVRARHRPSPDEPMRPVDAVMVLVAEQRNGDVMLPGCG
nr:hypothetical protein SHINE37_80049 [Rhizobiaceae bacterium]